MARFVFRAPVENRFGGIDFGFVTGEYVVSNTLTEVIGRFDSTIFGEVTLTVIGEGLRLGDGASGFFSAGFLNSASLSAGGRLLFSVSEVDLPVRQVGDIITGPQIYAAPTSSSGRPGRTNYSALPVRIASRAAAARIFCLAAAAQTG